MKCVAAILAGSVLMSAGSIASASIIYTNDPNLADFASATTNFATLSNFHAGDVSSPYTTTFSSLSMGLRAYGGGSLPGLPGTDWILATFSRPVSDIRVFPNIDHVTSGFDGYQYDIFGSNNATTWTPLFDVLTVTGSSPRFTIGSFTGTAPALVNNVLTPGAGPNGTVGYIADFDFGAAYKFYAFGSSDVAVDSGNKDQELSGVADMTVPEPATWVMFLVGFGALGLMMRWRRKTFALSAAG